MGDERRVTVLACIGCGGISTPDVCTGACSDRRLDLVEAGDHQAAVDAVVELEALLALRRAMLRRVADSPLTRADWDALREPAKAALHEPPRVERGAVVTTWECGTCGRIEAPRDCIGVCVRPAIDLVAVEAHQVVIDQARRLERELERLAPPLRQLAWSTPRPGRHGAASAGLRAAALAASSAA